MNIFNRPVRELNSDIHLIDKLLYLITPLIFLVTSFTLWTILGAPTGSEIKFTCWAPAQFTHEWVEYSNDACHYGQGSLYTPGDLEDPKSKHDHANRINYVSTCINSNAIFETSKGIDFNGKKD